MEIFLHSDKADSLVDEMMKDTPSNYNFSNRTFDDKSPVLKDKPLHVNKAAFNLQGTLD